nr:MAG TPA: hypothetical protein [Herelleviridae sp.]
MVKRFEDSKLKACRLHAPRFGVHFNNYLTT